MVTRLRFVFLLSLVMGLQCAFAQAPIISYASPQTYPFGTAIAPLVPASNAVAPAGYPATINTLSSAFNSPFGIAPDAAGNVYVADNGNNAVKEILVGGSIVTIGAGFNQPTGVAVDAAGNVYVADFGNNAIKKVPVGGGAVVTLASGFSGPYGIAVDASGNVYVSDANNNQVKKIPAGSNTPVIIGIGFLHPTGVAVDAAGNVYVADNGNNAIKEILAVDGSTVNLGAGLGNPNGVAVDNAGNVYFADASSGAPGQNAGAGSIVEIPAGGGGQINIGSGFTSPFAVAVSGANVLYATALGFNNVYDITPSGGCYINPHLPPGLNFDNNTGTISGTPTSQNPPTNYTVTAYNSIGSGTATVNIKITNPANLAQLVISSGGLTPKFAVDTVNYKVLVAQTVASVTIKAVTVFPLCTIKINGTTVASGATSAPISLNAGPNIINTVITAQDGVTTKTYTITVYKGATNATLSNLKLSSGTLAPAFNYLTTGYTASVSNATTSTTVTPSAADANATITVNGTAVKSKATSGPIPLNAGPNVITTVVSAQNGVTTDTYTITVTRAPSTNAALNGLSISNGTLSPGFDPNVVSYTAGVDNTVNSLIVTPVASDPNASITVNGAGITPGTPSTTIPLSTGLNTITVLVTAQDGTTTDTYTITATRAPSTNATLSSLSISNGALSPAFDPTLVSYTDTVDNTVSSITVTPAAADPNASVTVNGTGITPGAPSATLTLTPGLNSITILVTAQDGTTTETYTLNVTRQLSADAILDALTISPGVMAPAFESDITDYTASVTIVKIDHTIYTMGDSITANGEYQAMLDSLLNNQFNIVNFAIRGDLSSGMVARFPVIVNSSPDYVIILAGITDISGNGLTVAEVETNLEAMYTEAHNAGIMVIALTMTPFKGNPNWTAAKQTEEDQINAWIPTAANVDFVIDTYSGLVDPANPNHLLPQYDSSNHVHPSKAGQDEIAQLIYSGVNFVPNPAVDQLNIANTSVTITPVGDDPNETIAVNGSSVNSGAASAPIPLSVGANNIVAKTTAQDGTTTKSYTVTVTGNPSTNASLANLNLFNGGLTLSPIFSPDITNYTATEQFNLPNEVITATAADTTARITINGTPISSGAPTDSIFLNVGPNVITTVVTAQDGVTTKTYTVTITRTATSNAFLSNLQLSNGIPLLPAFSASQFKYVTNVSNAVTSVQVTPVADDNLATVTVNNASVLSGSPSKAINLSEGANIITTAVTSEDGTVKQSYVITITRALSTPNLAALHLSAGTLSTVFSSGVTAYSASVSNSTTSVTVTPTTTYSTATVAVNGISVASGAASPAIPLSVGPNTINILVTAINGSTQIYTVTVTRAASTNANLARLLISKGTLTPAFAAATTGYTASEVNSVSSITATPTTSDPTASITVNGTAVTSGTASAPIPLSVGANTITITVTAQDGITKRIYTITVTRASGAANSLYVPVSVEVPALSPNLAGDGVVVHPGISPNGDGINDFLWIENITSYPENKLAITNRNGTLIYEAKGYDNSAKVFDGHSSKTGQMQLPGTYFYLLEYDVNGVTKHKTGFIVLKY